jgi:UDP-N-acetylglucosamine 2-epimerase
MRFKKVVSIVGVRPNFVKLAALNPYLHATFDHVIIHTGQHYDYELSKAFFECLDIPSPDYNLEVGSGTHGYQLGEMVKRLEKVLLNEDPQLVIVYGDANSTLAGALAAARLQTQIAHVEAGYRSYDRRMPEEVNRLLTDQVSDFLFVPTKTSLENLKRENVRGEMHLTGDVMVDLLLKYMETAEEKSTILEKLCLNPKEYLLVTIHREDNTDGGMRIKQIVEAMLTLKAHTLVFPVHPRTKKTLVELHMYDELKKAKNIVILKPLNYLDFIKLEKNALKILSDSGGVQKEAYILGIPCITLRDKTELTETVEEGWNILADADTRKIIDAVETFFPQNTRPRNTLGDGNSGAKIAGILMAETY